MNKIADIILRYAILLILTFPNLYLFYLIFTPLTIYFSYTLFDIFFEVSLSGSTIFFPGFLNIQFIDACIAGSAYYILTVLNLSTPGIKSQQRLKLLLFTLLAFFLLNSIRIFILGLFLISSSPFFDITHRILWYAGSTLFVVGIWFTGTKIFKIKNIPIYSDIKFLQGQR